MAGSNGEDPILTAEAVSAGYRETVAIRDVDLEVSEGELVTLLGANGAGKSTTLLTLAGVLKPMRGGVRWRGSLDFAPLHRRAKDGLSFVTEQRSVFMGLSVRQNLMLARDSSIEEAIEIFPALEPLLERRGGLLSGGEQQMLTLARALSRPTRLLLADELSLGLAPQTTELLLDAVRRAVDGGMGALVVEQQVGNALRVADRVIVMRQGRIAYAGTRAEAEEDMAEIQRLYLAR